MKIFFLCILLVGSLAKADAAPINYNIDIKDFVFSKYLFHSLKGERTLLPNGTLEIKIEDGFSCQYSSGDHYNCTVLRSGNWRGVPELPDSGWNRQLSLALFDAMDVSAVEVPIYKIQKKILELPPYETGGHRYRLACVKPTPQGEAEGRYPFCNVLNGR
jgi:hypothetical protein